MNDTTKPAEQPSHPLAKPCIDCGAPHYEAGMRCASCVEQKNREDRAYSDNRIPW